MEKPIFYLMDDFGGKPIIFGNTHIYLHELVVFYGKCRGTIPVPMDIMDGLWAMKWP